MIIDARSIVFRLAVNLDHLATLPLNYPTQKPFQCGLPETPVKSLLIQ
jgi:hypothetical protein